MSSDTVSEMTMTAHVSGGGEITAKLFKHLSPATLAKIQRSVPIIGRLNQYEKSFVYILTNVVSGEEKARREFKRGDIAFMPSGSSICIFLEDTKSYKPMNPLGTIVSGLESLESVKKGAILKIESLQPSF